MTAASRTVAALLTPMGPGAIAVVAIRGPDAERIAAEALRRGAVDGRGGPTAGESATPRRDVPLLRKIVDGASVLDDAIIVCRDASNVSDGISVELHVHGGVRVAQRVLMLLERLGASLVTGEVFAWGESDCNPMERAFGSAMLRCESRRLAEWLLAQREILPAYLAQWAHHTATERAAFERRTRTAIRLLSGLRVAIVGPPNAGKSTLANRLIGHDRVLTSDVPGTTRDWVSESAMIDGWPVTLVDTAGVRETTCAIEAEAIQRGTAHAREADLVLLVVDATTEAVERDPSVLRIVDSLTANVPWIAVRNKCDLGDRATETWPGDEIGRRGAVASLGISARTGAGLAELEQAVCRVMGLDELRDDLPTGFAAEHILDCLT